ncbi:IgGFc-binding protein [Nannocystis bainbridge]|uniref:IgGFc-binding protein n=1 Tax=Nannocystis bainbridge TaxID=2995303 RepID=A0ABT5E5V8_9BACT|nr:IgGFc-binding protein [Nannocystis bainbridge]MDC0721240.1 IgGFc-binding protein [Nannocystis bainbridge]
MASLRPFVTRASLVLSALSTACGDNSGVATESSSASTTLTTPTSVTDGPTTDVGTASITTGTGTDTLGGTDSVSATESPTTTGTTSTSTTDATTGPVVTTGTETDVTTIDPSRGTTEDTDGTCIKCTADLHGIETCNGQPIATCEGTDGCDAELVACINACQAAENSKQSVGCEYYATFMQHHDGPQSRCFAAFVANTWNTPAKLAVTRQGQTLDIAKFARIPSGMGPGLTYGPYDADAGLAPGEVAILFLAGPKGAPMQGSAPCPVDSAVPQGAAVAGTGLGDSFRISADVPVVAYQINPYGGGSAAVTGASLLLPTSAWDTNYIVINSLQASVGQPSANIVAHSDGTKVTIEPVVALAGGGGIPGGPPGVPLEFTLNAGQHAQLTQGAELTGSVIQSDKPIGLMGGHTGMQAPVGTPYSDHAEQMIPPIRALGSEYVGVMHRPRVNEPAMWRVVGAVDGTELTWSGDVGGPTNLARGQKVEFVTATPFVVESQDDEHPFFLFTYMSGSGWQPNLSGHGDSDYVISVPVDQYLPRYVFFTDPTYPETNLVLVRKKTEADVFEDVTLDCSGVVGGWQPVGDYEWTRVDLSTGDFQPVAGCSTGRHEITSDGRFGMWIWGWGSPKTTVFTQNVSYGYPAGMNVQLINDVIIIPQ